MKPSSVAHLHPHHPVIFEEFFELGLEEAASPFLTVDTRHWSANLHLKASLLAALLLFISFVLSFFPRAVPLSHFTLVFVYFLAGIPALIDSIEDLLSWDVNIDVLMTLAAFLSVLIGSGIEGGLLLVLFSLSGAMEEAVTAKAKNSLSSLHKLSPTKANVIEEDGTLIERFLSDVMPGTRILVKSGQVVPLDGMVLEGASSVNLVHLTGENMPVTKKKDDTIQAGARNMEGALVIRVTHTSADSTLAKIIQLVTQAQEAKPLLQRWFDKLSRSYAISIILLSLFFALSFPWIYSMPYLGFEGSIYRSLAFLIAASPCALIIALPIAYLSAIGACAKKGILLKGGISLDALASCRAIAFDKTGTLTTGNLTCEGLESLGSYSSQDMDFALAVAASMEQNSTHPVARSIVAYAKQKNILNVPLVEFKTIPGYGLEAKVMRGGILEDTLIGNMDFILSKLSQASSQALMQKKREYQGKGEALSVLLLGNQLYIFRFRDTLRPFIKETVESLKKKWKLTPYMLTGDHEQSARAVAEASGIEKYYANLKPEDKLELVTQFSAEQGLAMVGDGINDAPALARATVGIGMGKVGSSTALDASDIILLQDNIELLDWLFDKSVATQNIVRQNLCVAAAAICIACIPALAGIVPLWLAVVLHEGGTVLVGLNGLRLLRK